MDKLVSIIVPIYNVEKYLEKCINSIRNQTLQNIEIVLVDDGSTDRSAYLCDYYKSLDQRITVIHQENAGLTVARRNGVNASHGRFVGFVDGDDWIEPYMYESLYKHALDEKVDIVTSRGYRDYENGVKSTRTLGDSIPQGKYIVDDEEKYLLKHVFSSAFTDGQHLNGAVWNKIFRREIISKVLNKMNDNVHGCMDDNVCVVGSVISSDSVYVSNDCYYHHREREDAFTYSKNSNGLLQINYAYLDLRKMIYSSKYSDILIDLLEEHTSNRIIAAYNILFDKQNYKLPQYLFESDKIPLESKVVVYGYGNVGKAYVKQIRNDGKYNLVGVIDKNAAQIKNDMVYSAEILDKIEYDFIIIAVVDRTIAEDIQNSLLQRNISRSKIIFEKPLTIFEYYQ